VINKLKRKIDNYLEQVIETYLKHYFEYYFIKYFPKYFNEHSKDLFITKNFNDYFDKRLQETFIDEFNNSFDKMLNSFDINDTDIIEAIQIAESKYKKGNGEEKLKFACSFYAEKNKEEIMRIAQLIIKDRVNKVFEANKKQINNMIMDKPICL